MDLLQAICTREPRIEIERVGEKAAVGSKARILHYQVNGQTFTQYAKRVNKTKLFKHRIITGLGGIFKISSSKSYTQLRRGQTIGVASHSASPTLFIQC